MSTRDVATAAGANQALVYRYFGSKEALLVEALSPTEPDSTIADTPLDDLPHTLLRRALDPDAPAEIRASSMSTLVAGAGTELVRTIARDRIHAGFTTQLAGRLDGPDTELRAELWRHSSPASRRCGTRSAPAPSPAPTSTCWPATSTAWWRHCWLTDRMVEPVPEPEPLIDPTQPIPDDPGELLPDAPEPLPPPPIEATPDDPGGDPGGVPEPA